MTIYFLSGLGADRRVFKNLVLPQNTSTVFLDWIRPEKSETIEHYAERLAENIDTLNPFVLVGLSFGGMLATEIAQFLHPKKTILISSASCIKELPLLYRFAGKLRLNRLLPTSKLIYHPVFIPYKRIGAESAEDRALINEMHASTDIHFSKWAISVIINWKRNKTVENIIRIHGNKDKVLPIINFIPNYLIEHGGHLMIVNKAEEISAILAAEIADI